MCLFHFLLQGICHGTHILSYIFYLDTGNSQPIVTIVFTSTQTDAQRTLGHRTDYGNFAPHIGGHGFLTTIGKQVQPFGTNIVITLRTPHRHGSHPVTSGRQSLYFLPYQIGILSGRIVICPIFYTLT